MQFAKYFLLSTKTRLASAAFGAVATLSMFAAVVMMFASTSGEFDPALATLQLGSPAAEAVTRLAKLKPVSPASPSASEFSGKPGSG